MAKLCTKSHWNLFPHFWDALLNSEVTNKWDWKHNLNGRNNYTEGIREAGERIISLSALIRPCSCWEEVIYWKLIWLMNLQINHQASESITLYSTLSWCYYGDHRGQSTKTICQSSGSLVMILHCMLFMIWQQVVVELSRLQQAL